MSSSLSYKLKGDLIDSETRCIHYHTLLDIIALRFKCCDTYYPCYQCHLKEGHSIVKYNKQELYDGTKVILCGVCKTEWTFKEYLDGGYSCNRCASAFNPGCASHYGLYFDLDQQDGSCSI